LPEKLSNVELFALQNYPNFAKQNLFGQITKNLR